MADVQPADRSVSPIAAAAIAAAEWAAAAAAKAEALAKAASGAMARAAAAQEEAARLAEAQQAAQKAEQLIATGAAQRKKASLPSPMSSSRSTSSRKLAAPREFIEGAPAAGFVTPKKGTTKSKKKSETASRVKPIKTPFRTPASDSIHRYVAKLEVGQVPGEVAAEEASRARAHQVEEELQKMVGGSVAAIRAKEKTVEAKRAVMGEATKTEAEKRAKEKADRIYKAKRTKMVNAELQVAMSKAKADADRKEAEEEAKAAAELAAEAAAKAMAEAEMYQRALASYLASDASPAAKAAKKAMESTHCASPRLDPPPPPPRPH